MGALFKWNHPEVGDTRSVRRFLLFPGLISGEWRWLGYENIKQERIHFSKHTRDWWVDKEWAE